MKDLREQRDSFCLMIEKHFISEQDEKFSIEFCDSSHYERFTDSFQYYANFIYKNEETVKITAKFCIKRNDLMKVTNFIWEDLFDDICKDGPEIKFNFSYKDMGNNVLRSI